MRTSKSAAAPPASLTSPKSCATKRQRKAAAAAPLGDVTNLLVVAETPTTSKPRRTARRSLPAPSNVSAASSASVTPAPKPSAAASATPVPKPSSATSVTLAPKPSSAAGKKDTRPISASAPCHEGKKKRSIASTPNLLEDLLEKQRVYFADIDAFELVEEEASESELE
ncbi:uncharacterized protein [Miscanthus floridulus]|uniref:uncharacterized protein n=1 Tax=Miscanthus floridulus TaxID=154761 RepID=UPI00345A1F82